MKVMAPGKLILSGEHAVVYGAPAMAVAVNRYVTVNLAGMRPSRIHMILSDFAYQNQFSLTTLKSLKTRLKRKYHRFIQGEYAIRDVIKKPFELAQYALGLCVEALDLSLPEGMTLDVQSSIPIGSGMGSSAATIVCVIYALAARLGKTLSADTLFKLALEAENMQHGRSSGLDLQVAQHGGCVLMHGKQIKHYDLTPSPTFYLVDTGRPLSGTGECVETVQTFFKNDQLITSFAEVTLAIKSAFLSADDIGLQAAIRDNHRLLSTIGVVPDRVHDFISRVEKLGGAAKICGAGSIRGNAGGIVWVLSDKREKLVSICNQYGYTFFEIKGESRGVHVV